MVGTFSTFLHMIIMLFIKWHPAVPKDPTPGTNICQPKEGYVSDIPPNQMRISPTGCIGPRREVRSPGRHPWVHGAPGWVARTPKRPRGGEHDLWLETSQGSMGPRPGGFGSPLGLGDSQENGLGTGSQASQTAGGL